MIIKPIFTEKSLKVAKMGNYTFRVEPRMDKKRIAAEIAKIFGVNVIGVEPLKPAGKKEEMREARIFHQSRQKSNSYS